MEAEAGASPGETFSPKVASGSLEGMHRVSQSEGGKAVWFRILCAVTAVMLSMAPASAAQTKKARPSTKSKSVAVKASKKTASSLEESAWSTPKNQQTKKPQAKKVSNKEPKLEPTVSWSKPETAKPSSEKTTQTASKTESTETTKTTAETTKPAETTVATAQKPAEEQEKAANALLSKDPRAALAQYRTLISNNPDYKYIGDVYVNAYAAAEKSNAPILDKIELAGKAAMFLKQGRTRGPVDQRLIQKYENLTDKWINAWIEEEIRKAKAGQ
jgi:flagellar biosynthesis GTPase FlhF